MYWKSLNAVNVEFCFFTFFKEIAVECFQYCGIKSKQADVFMGNGIPNKYVA